LQGDLLASSMRSRTSSSCTSRMSQSSVSTFRTTTRWKPSPSGPASSSTVLGHSPFTAPQSSGTCVHGTRFPSVSSRELNSLLQCLCADRDSLYGHCRRSALDPQDNSRVFPNVRSPRNTLFLTPFPRFDYLASKNKAIIIPASGFDSVPRYFRTP
jgi:hypothetical protein